MAGTHRIPQDHLTHPLAALAAEPHAFDFYQALRLLECVCWEKPRLGESPKPGQDPIRLGQEPSLAFAPAGLSRFALSEDDQPHRLAVRFFGLLGTNGPLPLHLTEYILARRRDHGDRTWEHFLDLFHHRMLSLFYRAWANNEPTVEYDRPEEDRFGTYVGALAGLGIPALRKRDAIDDHTKFYYCGWLAGQSKCVDGLAAVLNDYFAIPVAVEEFVGEWLPMPAEHICRLGIDGANGDLGKTTIAGTRVWSWQHKFRIHLGPLSLADYQRFLPSGDRIGRLVPLVRNYIGDELAWDVRLILAAEQVPQTRLNGNCRLGWTTWLSKTEDGTDADDLVLDALHWVARKES